MCHHTSRSIPILAMIAIAAIFAAALIPAYAWAATDTDLQSGKLATQSTIDYYAVLHEDGSLVFQARPSSEEGATNYAGSCAAYASGEAPWLASAKLIESVRFDESFANTKPQSLAFWFIGCENLKTIDLQNLDASKSTSMRSMFSGCSSLSTIENLSTFDTSSSTYFGSMFRNCSSLTSLDISHFDATHVGVLCFMFAGCTNLETLNMAGEGWRTSSLYLMVHVWEDCSSLKSLDLSYLDTSGVHSMAKDFNGCSSLEYLDLSGADTTEVGSLDNMFTGCSELKTVKLGPKFTFNGKADAPQCHLPGGKWRSASTGTVYDAVDVPNNTADTYTRVEGGGTDPSGSWSYEPGEYPLPNLKSSLGMFDHFVVGSQKLTVTDDTVTLEFTTDGSIKFVRFTTKVAIGRSSQLCNMDDMVEGETKYTSSLLGDPAVFEGALVSSEGESNQYSYQLVFDKDEFRRLIETDGGIYLTLFYSEKRGWHKGDNDLLITLGDSGQGGGGGGSDDPEHGESIIADLDEKLVDGTYPLELMVLPSMVKLSGHNGQAQEPRLVVSGDDAWVVVSYRSSLGSAWRYSQMKWGSYEVVVAAGEDGMGGAPTFKEGMSAADGMSDGVLESMTFALPISKADFIAWAVSGENREFAIRYVNGYSGDHDGDWWRATEQPIMMVTDVYAAVDPIEVPADYARVLHALAKVPKDLSIYTDESVQSLEDVLAMIDGLPKPAAQQADVDSMADAVLEAVGSLEKKGTEPAFETGWKMVDGTWYYYYEDGTMATSKWQKDDSGEWCYLGKDGARYENRWAKDSKYWYFMGADGHPVKSKWMKDSHDWVYLGADGAMVTNKWAKDSRHWYYMGANGYMVKTKWQKDSKDWCYLGSDGVMYENRWAKDSKYWYFMGADGHPVKNKWQNDSKGRCYLDANGHALVSTTATIDGARWKFDSAGHATRA